MQERLEPHPPTPSAHPEGLTRSWLLGAKVGDGFPCFVEGCQQGVRVVLRLNADLLVGQVNVELHSYRKKETGMWEGEAGPFHSLEERGHPP